MLHLLLKKETTYCYKIFSSMFCSDMRDAESIQTQRSILITSQILFQNLWVHNTLIVYMSALSKIETDYSGCVYMCCRLNHLLSELGHCGYVERLRLGYYVTEYADSACLLSPLYLRTAE